MRSIKTTSDSAPAHAKCSENSRFKTFNPVRASITAIPGTTELRGNLDGDSVAPTTSTANQWKWYCCLSMNPTDTYEITPDLQLGTREQNEAFKVQTCCYNSPNLYRNVHWVSLNMLFLQSSKPVFVSKRSGFKCVGSMRYQWFGLK